MHTLDVELLQGTEWGKPGGGGRVWIKWLNFIQNTWGIHAPPASMHSVQGVQQGSEHQEVGLKC